MINCLVVDDEPIARQGLLEHISQIDFLHTIAACKNAIEASSFLNKQPVDLIFLDIQMPKLTGIEFIKQLKNPPLIILTTAYPEYAIEGYELNVLDYLLKPISFTRFLKSALKVQEYLIKQNNASIKHNDYFFIKCDQKLQKIVVKDVLYVEAMSNYVVIHTKNKKFITYITFKGLEEKLPPELFIRIHKSYIVSIHSIEAINPNEVILEKNSLPLSKTYRDEVINRIGDWIIKR